ncbi:MAG: ATP-binding protein, partial [Gemmatimonadaceae bacterium]
DAGVSDGVDSARLDSARLAALRSTELLDTDIEDAFDRVTKLAVRLVDVPAAFISLVDANRDFYKSACGFPEPLATSRELSGPTFCHFTILSTEPLVIPDAMADERYRDIPTVRSLGVAAYVGIPLVVDGQVIGALCAVDSKPRAWTRDEIATLVDLSAIALSEIELRRARRSSERARDESEAWQIEAEVARGRMTDVFRQAPVFIAVLRGTNHVFELINDEYAKVVGGRAVVGKAVSECLPEVRDQGFIDLLDGVLRTGVPYVGRELPLELHDTGTAPVDQRFVTFVYQPLTDADGTRSGIFVLGTDVTHEVLARKEVEALNGLLKTQTIALEVQAEELMATNEELESSTEELRERTEFAERAREAAERSAAALLASEARYRTLTEAVPVQVWTAKPDGMLDYVSASTAAYFGAPQDELLGIGWTSFLHPDDILEASGRWGASLATGNPYQAEFRLKEASSNEYRWHLARALPDRNPEGFIVGWTGSNTDVESERRARDEARAANRSKSEFLTTMSHELRTPLNAIGGYAQLLEAEIRGPISDQQRSDLERIQYSQRHLLGLINGILNYAKIDAGMMAYARESVAVSEVIATCESLTLPQLRDKQLIATFPVKAAVVAIGDREKIQQILLNLLSNAIKFTGRGGSIVVSCESDDESIIIRVTDTGRGIPSDSLPKIFDPFVQVDARLTRDQQGTGLGLAISRDLARGMGGELTVASTLGEGSEFSLRLTTANE